MALSAGSGYRLGVLERRHLRFPPARTATVVADALVVTAVLAAAALEPVWELVDQQGWRWVAAALLTATALLLRRRAPLVALGGVLAVWLAVHTATAHDAPSSSSLLC